MMYQLNKKVAVLVFEFSFQPEILNGWIDGKKDFITLYIQMIL